MGQLEDLIMKCEKAISDKDHSVMPEICMQYTFGYDTQVAALTNWSYDEMSKRMDERIKQIHSGLTSLKEKRDFDLALANASSSRVSSTANASALSSIEMTLNNTVSQLWQIPDEDLGIDQKRELEGLLQDIEASKEDATALSRAGKAIANWLFDNAIKAIPTVMPYLTQTIQKLFS